MSESVPPNSLKTALAHIKAGGSLIVPTYTHCTVINQRTVDREGKGSVYLVPGQLKYA